jgi:anti-anti-sigma factor
MLQLGLQTGRSAVSFTLKGFHVEVCGERAAASDFLVSLNNTRDARSKTLPEISVRAPSTARVKGPPNFSCLCAGAGSVARVTVAGELDIATAPELERALRRPAVDPAVVFLDLRELEFMDSSGLHVILAADRRVRSAGGQLVIVRGPAQVDRLLALVGIDCQLELVDQPPAAAREDVAA